jgi:hypothetical protein
MYYQHDSPGAEKETNWVPAQKNDFSLYIRAGRPKKEILEGTWMLLTVQLVK